MLLRQEDQQFMIFDGCIAPIWEQAFIGDPNDPNVNLTAKIYVLDDPYMLYFDKPYYEKENSSPGNVCGNIVYTIDLPYGIITTLDNAPNLVIETEVAFIIYL